MDKHKLELFTERLLVETNAAMSCLNLYLGYRLNLFRSLMGKQRSTPKELAAITGCSERYVKEWLECMTAGGYLVQEPTERYSLPLEHAAVLVDHDDASFAMPFVCFIPALAGVLPKLEDAFRSGEGVPIENYDEGSREAIGQGNRSLFISEYVDKWLPKLPDVVERLKAGGKAVDVGCGAGWSSIALAKKFPDVRIDAVDPDFAAIKQARRNANQEGVTDQIRFYCSTIERAPLGSRYDLVTAFDCLHMMAYPVQALKVMRRLISFDGAVLIAEKAVGDTLESNGNLLGHMSYNLSVLHCLPLAMDFPETAAIGAVMGFSKLKGYATQSGFSKVEVLPIENRLLRFYRLAA
jgi:SAM-dependent methyltransferase